MVKYRRRQFRKRGRKTPWYNRKYNAMQLASAAWRGVRYVKGLVNSEMYYHTLLTTVNPLNTGSIIPLSDIAVGDTSFTRTGNSIFARSLTFNINASQNPSSVKNTFVRMILFQDNQQIGDTAPTQSDILESSSPLSLLKTGTAGRFKIMKTWEYTLSTQNPAKVIKYYKNFRHHIRYNGVEATDIQKGGLYLLVNSSETIISNQAPIIHYNIRLGYHDN